MRVFLFRPSPQVPNPSVRSAIICYDASAYNIKMQAKQMDAAVIDITWVFLLTLFMAVNTILWSISYPEVRALHRKEELEENIDTALDIIVKCRERWPGTAAASNLYSTLAKACLRSYDTTPPPSRSANSPSSLTDNNSPSASEHSTATNGSLAHSQHAFSSPLFSNVFPAVPEQIPEFDYDTPPPLLYAPFRSNSIFENPPSGQTDRRFSYFPPEFVQPSTLPTVWHPMPLPNEPGAVPNTVIADSSYFMQPTPYAFTDQLYPDQSYDTNMRQGSLSQQQQVELMQSLETYGLTEIDNFMNLSAQYDNIIKP